MILFPSLARRSRRNVLEQKSADSIWARERNAILSSLTSEAVYMTATYLYYAKIKFILAIMSESIYDGKRKNSHLQAWWVHIPLLLRDVLILFLTLNHHHC